MRSSETFRSASSATGRGTRRSMVFSRSLVRQESDGKRPVQGFRDLKKGLESRGRRRSASSGEQSILFEALKKGGLPTDCGCVFLATGDQYAALQNKDDRRHDRRRAVRLDFGKDRRGRAVYDGRYVLPRPAGGGRDFRCGPDEKARGRDTVHERLHSVARATGNDAQVDGKLAGKGADEMVEILAKYSKVKDKALLRAVVPSACDPPDARPNVEGLQKDLEFIQSLRARFGRSPDRRADRGPLVRRGGRAERSAPTSAQPE